MAKSHAKHSTTVTAATPVIPEASQTLPAPPDLHTTETLEATTDSAQTCIEVRQAWRRAATRSALQKLWHAMELSREADPANDDDRCLADQRNVWRSVGRMLLGDDAPEMEMT